MMRHISRPALLALFLVAFVPAAFAAAPQATDLTKTFRGAGAAVDKLQVYELSGIVVIRGRANDKSQAELLSRYATLLGYNRVANLVQLAQDDDVLIARNAERALATHRSLDGCRFAVHSEHGIVRVNGQVQHELQKDVAMQVLRAVDGVRGVQIALDKF